MNKWIMVFELEDGDSMPEHIDFTFKGGRIDGHSVKYNDILRKVEKLKIEAPEHYCDGLCSYLEGIEDTWDIVNGEVK